MAILTHASLESVVEVVECLTEVAGMTFESVFNSGRVNQTAVLR